MAGSRVFRQTCAIEVIWLVDAGRTPPHTDLEAVMREHVQAGEVAPGCWTAAGEIWVSPIEELTP